MKTQQGHTLKVAATTVVLLAGGLGLFGQAEGEKSGLRKFFEQDYLFGDWGGLRTNLRDQHGVDFEFMYAASVPTAVDGGIDHGSVYEGALLMMLNVDTAKAGLWANGDFRASSLYIHNGRRFSSFVGDLNQTSLLDFPDTFRLWELFYEQKFLDGKVSLKAGQLDIGMDFIVPEYYTSIGQVNFLNQTFFYPTMAFNVYDQPGFPPGKHALAATPYAAPGVRLKADLTPRTYAQFGAYDGNPDRSFSGTKFHLDGDEGALLYFELGYRNHQLKGDSGLPGNFKVGGWYHTDGFVDMLDGYLTAAGAAVTPPRFHNGNYGVYFLADHMLYREHPDNDPANQGLVGFFRAAYAPPDRNLAQLGIDGGLVYKGLIPGRDWDTLGVAFSYLQISDDLRKAQDFITANVAPGLVPRADYEAVLELNYKVQLAAWCAVDLSAQRVIHPGGRVAPSPAFPSLNTPDAWVFILQTTFRF